MSKTILVVDDDTHMRQLLTTHLKGTGYDVAEAENGSLALEYIECQSVDMILMDINMPVLNGIETTKMIRKSFKRGNLPIIVLSAEEDKKEWVRAIKAGANDYVQKPYHKSELLARIATNLNVATLNNKLAIRTKELSEINTRLERDQAYAAEVQRMILPQQFDIKGFDIETYYKPSQSLSGDFYDVIDGKQFVTFIIGDVSGHGTTAALIMFAAKSLLSSFAKVSKTSLEIVTMIDRMIYGMLQDSGLFFTLVFIRYHKKTHEIEIISAGHSTIYVNQARQLIPFHSTGRPIGWDFETSWDVERITLDAGDGFFLCTDGLIEVMNENEEQFGKERLVQALENELAPDILIKKVISNLRDFSKDPYRDDIAMLAVQKN